jgi:hypothetical protein
MYTGLLKVLGAALLLSTICNSVAAQPYRQLTADDFQGNPGHDGMVIAYTHCDIDMRYDVSTRKGWYELTFYIQVIMNKDRSWIDRSRITSQTMLAEILRHEQGHYTIAYFEQQELLRTFGRTVFRADYQAAVKEIFDRIHAKYAQLTKDYDGDTEHSLNRAQQESWNKYFDRRLEYMPPLGK